MHQYKVVSLLWTFSLDTITTLRITMGLLHIGILLTLSNTMYRSSGVKDDNESSYVVY